jgi:hypothetical protein
VLLLWLEQSGALDAFKASVSGGPHALDVALRLAGDVLDGAPRAAADDESGAL